MNNQSKILGQPVGTSSNEDNYLALNDNGTKVDYISPKVKMGNFTIDPTKDYISTDQPLSIYSVASSNWVWCCNIIYKETGESESNSTSAYALSFTATDNNASGSSLSWIRLVS